MTARLTARRPLPTLLRSVPAPRLLLLALAVATALATVRGVRIEIINHCSDTMKLFDGGNTTRVKENASVTFVLPPNTNRAYRYGVSPQATLAEFAVDAHNTTWFDISIIPTGPLSGPKHCQSLSACKTLTGGVGFNKPMQINPRIDYDDSDVASTMCRKLICLADGCDDAYQFPQQDEKTHACAANIDFQVVFCPTVADTALLWIPTPSSLENKEIAGDAALSTATPAASSLSPRRPLTTSSSSSDTKEEVVTQSMQHDESSAAAAIVASVLGGVFVFAAVVVAVMRYRQRQVANVEYDWPDRKSSDAMSFVSALDVI